MEPLKHLELKWFSLDQLPEDITIPTKYALKCYKQYLKKVI